MSVILVVDDSQLVRGHIVEALHDAGHETIEANNGKVAIDVVASNSRIDCVLLDLNMPVLDGFGMLQQLRESDIATPVVVCSADVQRSTRTRCHFLGAKVVISKPARSGEILAAVEHAVNDPNRQRS